MKILIISDSHGNIANIKVVLGFAKKIKANGIIHLGDWDNIKAVEEILTSDVPLYSVLGNADIHMEIKDVLKKYTKGFNENYLEFKMNEKLIGVVHNINDFVFSKYKPDIIFCGHRHFKSERVIKGIKVISPGALHSIKPSFAVYDTDANRVEFFDL